MPTDTEVRPPILPGPTTHPQPKATARVGSDAHGSASLPLDSTPKASEGLETSSQKQPKPKDRRVVANLQLVDRLEAWSSDHGPGTPDPADDLIFKTCRKLRTCSMHAFLCRDVNTGAAVVIPCRCKSRLCAFCAPLRQARICARLKPELAKHPMMRMVTFTLKHSNTPLPAQTKRIMAAFARLRRSKLWTRAVTGGAFFFEPKYNQNTDEWHPHIHVLCVGEFIPKQKVLARWLKLTGDSFIIDMALVRGIDQAMAYVTRYVTKKTDTFWMPPNRLAEFVQTLAGLRMVQTFGILHKLKPEAKDKTLSRKVERIASVTNIRKRASEGDEMARSILTRIWHLHRNTAPVDAIKLAEDAARWAQMRCYQANWNPDAKWISQQPVLTHPEEPEAPP